MLLSADQEKKKWRPKQEGPWTRYLPPLLELLARSPEG
jgi:hypothetical protein